jgi:hypothetical protein
MKEKAAKEESKDRKGSSERIVDLLKNDGSSEDEDDSTLHSDDDEDGSGQQSESFVKMRREKRLAMNRASARARRKRKKVLLDSLGGQLSEMTSQNRTLGISNETLQARVQQLESALSQAQGTISALAAEARPSLQQPQQFGGGAAGLSAANQEAIRSLLLAAAPSLNQGALAGASLSDQLFSAQAAQLLGQPSQAQILEAAGLGGLRYQDVFGSMSSPMSSFLGQQNGAQQALSQLQQQQEQQTQQGMGGAQHSGEASGGVKRSHQQTRSAIADLIKKAKI